MDYKKKYCPICKRKTEHIKRGFGEVGGLIGNARLECLECNSIKKNWINKDSEY